ISSSESMLIGPCDKELIIELERFSLLMEKFSDNSKVEFRQQLVTKNEHNIKLIINPLIFIVDSHIIIKLMKLKFIPTTKELGLRIDNGMLVLKE
ncbi:MAG: hypothetical protein ACTSQ3_03005, partial [Candidatus Heimdallarchaeota archaeon]